MVRIHKFIIGVRKAEKEFLQRALRHNDPFGNKETRMVAIPRRLQYAREDTATVKLSMRKLRRQECESDSEWKRAEGVLNFISHTRWAKDPAEDGGITWLELYVWYKMHSKVEAEAPLDAKNTLQKEIAEFKKHARKIAALCVREQDEWHFHSAVGRGNRLKQAGVSNKHAAIKGIPKIPSNEAELITTAILAMKGAGAKKHRDAHQKGKLTLRSKPLAYRGAAASWKQHVAKHANWTAQPATPIEEVEEQIIWRVLCPVCSAPHVTAGRQAQQRSRFSNFKCAKCGCTKSAKLWSCPCGRFWQKCQLHVMAPTERRPKGRLSTRRGRLACDERGVDLPLPKRRKFRDADGDFFATRPPGRCIALVPGSKLAAKFPHLVRGTTPT